jgi:2-oxoglutarate ferredoxin oxidoreductase subunit beta
MWWPDFPVPVGVLRRTERPTHDQLMVGQIRDAITRQGQGDLGKLIRSGETWTVGG